MPPLSLPRLGELGAESRRLFHGRGGHVPDHQHLAIDWFSPVLLVTLYAERDSDAAVIDDLLERARAAPQIEAIVVQHRHRRGAPKETIFGELPADPTASESGLHYHLTLDRNRNHGFFLDMKSGRDWVRSRAAGKRVLNLFAYTCSLSVAAIAGGADTVVNLDMAGAALATGRRNHHLNFDNETCRRANYLPHNLFKSWGRLKRSAPFDLIIVDPPSEQAGSFVAERDYRRITRRLGELALPHSEILACLNSPHHDVGFLREVFAGYQFHQRLPAAPGFTDRDPQAALKCLVFSP
ncbi:MAG: class I SAM-dependent methyltransferase [Verrucomicrobiales bacterium]